MSFRTVHKPRGNTLALLDIGKTWISGEDKLERREYSLEDLKKTLRESGLVNLNLIQALKAAKIFDVYLFNEMYPTTDSLKKAQALKEVLQEDYEFTVHGVMIPADCAGGSTDEELLTVNDLTFSQSAEQIGKREEYQKLIAANQKPNPNPPGSAFTKAMGAIGSDEALSRHHLRAIYIRAFLFLRLQLENWSHIKGMLFQQVAQYERSRFKRFVVCDDDQKALASIREANALDPSPVNVKVVTITDNAKVNHYLNDIKSPTEYEKNAKKRAALITLGIFLLPLTLIALAGHYGFSKMARASDWKPYNNGLLEALKMPISLTSMLGGACCGAFYGVILGTMIFPGAGTAVGCILGSIAGAAFGSAAGALISKSLKSLRGFCKKYFGSSDQLPPVSYSHHDKYSVRCGQHKNKGFSEQYTLLKKGTAQSEFISGKSLRKIMTFLYQKKKENKKQLSLSAKVFKFYLSPKDKQVLARNKELNEAIKQVRDRNLVWANEEAEVKGEVPAPRLYELRVGNTLFSLRGAHADDNMQTPSMLHPEAEKEAIAMKR